MKACVFAFLLLFCYVECKKIYAPIDKNANLDFINMEGGGVRSGPKPVVPAPVAPGKPSQPAAPVQTTPKPVAVPTAKPAQPAVTPPQPKTPTQIKPVPVQPTPAVNPQPTPGPGSVQSLVNYYNSQGKGSVIRPYSYSQAVKQG